MFNYYFLCNTFCLAFLIGAVTLLICQNTVMAEEVPAFFLKIAKIPTLPRVGRSGRFEDFFYKAEKHIPRIGRSNQQVSDYYCAYFGDFDVIIILNNFWIAFFKSINPLQDEQETSSSLTKRRIDYPPKG